MKDDLGPLVLIPENYSQDLSGTWENDGHGSEWEMQYFFLKKVRTSISLATSVKFTPNSGNDPMYLVGGPTAHSALTCGGGIYQ